MTNMTTTSTITCTAQTPLKSPAGVDATMVTMDYMNRDRDAKPLEKWDAEECARSFVATIDGITIHKEYCEEIETIVVDESKCTIWKSNMPKNQSDKYPCFDYNIVKSQNSPGEYTNASIVNVPHISKPVIIGQYPRKEVSGALEEFWNTIFQNNVTLMIILVGDKDNLDFFPQVAGAYENYGTMFVNNRKVEHGNGSKFVIEVLPTGMSNSVLTQIYAQYKWIPGETHKTFSKTTKLAMELMQFGQNGTGCPEDRAMVLSKHGAGRAGYLVALASAHNALNNKKEPKIVEIVKKLREQRPLAVETMFQYKSIYLNIIYIIKKKIGDRAFDEKMKVLTASFGNL